MNDAKVLMSRVTGILDDKDVCYESSKSGRVIRTGSRIECGFVEILISAIEDPALLQVLVRLPLAAPENKRRDIAEAMMRVNADLYLGRFELDFRKGDMTFSASIPLMGTVLNDDQFHAVLGMALHSCDRYCRAFGRMMFDDDLTPAQAVAEVDMAEGDDSGS